jgi:hypothetical protein
MSELGDQLVKFGDDFAVVVARVELDHACNDQWFRRNVAVPRDRALITRHDDDCLGCHYSTLSREIRRAFV